MHLLYIDDSGDDGRGPASTTHFVLGGLAIHDSQWRPLVRRIDAIAAKHLGSDSASVELHGSDILSGRRHFRRMTPVQREALVTDVLAEVGSKERRLSLFFVVVHKASIPVTRDIRLLATLQLCQRFNSYLTRIGTYGRPSTKRGMLICDEHTSKNQITSLMGIIHSGGLPRQLKDNLIETAFFADSSSSRLIQVADILCHSVYCFVTRSDDRFFHLVERKIDRGRKSEPGSRPIHYGFRYIAEAPDAGLGSPLPFRHLAVTESSRLPKGSFLQVAALERELAAHGL